MEVRCLYLKGCNCDFRCGIENRNRDQFRR